MMETRIENGTGSVELDEATATLVQGAVIDMAEQVEDGRASARLRRMAMELDRTPRTVGALDEEGKALLREAVKRFTEQLREAAHVALLREHGYLGTRGEYYNQPTQRAMGMGLFEIKKTSITKPDGSVLVSSTTKVTGRGQVYFVNKFLNR